MNYDLNGKTIAILSTHGFEQSELMKPLETLKARGAAVRVISPESGSIKGWSGGDWGDSVSVDESVASADASAFEALVIPGGVMNPDKLRMDKDSIEFARAFFKAGKPVAAICHGPQVLIECDVLQGREVTSYPSLKTDLKNAGARWSDQEVVCDQALITSRTPDDLPAFIDKICEEVLEGKHAAQATA